MREKEAPMSTQKFKTSEELAFLKQEQRALKNLSASTFRTKEIQTIAQLRAEIRRRTEIVRGVIARISSAN